MENTTIQQPVRKLPLWQNLLEEIEKEGIDYGKSFDANYFEEALSCNRSSREFGLSVHKIRVELERKGFYLQGHAERDGKLVILPPEQNIGVARNGERVIRKRRDRSIALLTATNRDLLPGKLRSYHDKLLERLQIKRLIERRAGSIHKFIESKAPKLLKVGS